MLNKGLLLGKKIKLYNIIRGSVSNISLSYSPQTDIKAGTRVNITVNANSGYQNPWVTVSKNDGTGNVTVSGSGSSRYFTMPKSDVTITAGASVIPTYSVSGSASGGGISFSKTSGIRAGEVITVYLSPNSYYTLSSLTSSPSVSFSGRGNTRTFTMPNSNVRVTATFVAQYDFMIYVERFSYDGDDYAGYWEGHGGSKSNSVTLTFPYEGRSCKAPYKYFYTSFPTAPNPSIMFDIEVDTQTTFGGRERIDMQRVDTGKTVTLKGARATQSFSSSKDLGAEGFYPTVSDVGKWIPYKVTRDIYRI